MERLLISLFLAILIIGTPFTCLPEASAMSKDEEIEFLKKRLEEIERRRNTELEELKRRIEALEKDKREKEEKTISPTTEVEELKESVGELRAKLEMPRSSFEQIAQFVERYQLKFGLRLQTWYQYVDEGKKDKKGLNDFMLRRAYFYLKGQITPQIGFFAHFASDRIGQDGLDKSSLGLGSGIAVRDAWIYLNLHEAFKIQMGRMYIPFTRSFGTESTFALLAVDLPFTQGGVRGAPFFTNRVGRDEGFLVWGNPFDGLLQYRVGVFEGVENDDNPHDNVRFAGRVSLNLLEPEKNWFNKGTYLGEKKVLALGAGIDYQDELNLNEKPNRDNLAWTVDFFLDHPVGKGALTLEGAFIDVKNATQTLGFSRLVEGDDAYIYYLQGGYLFPGKIGPGRIQPYFRYERLTVDGKSDTSFPSIGLNYYIKGHNARFTLDCTYLDQEKETKIRRGNFSGDDQFIATLQFATGF